MIRIASVLLCILLGLYIFSYLFLSRRYQEQKMFGKKCWAFVQIKEQRDYEKEGWMITVFYPLVKMDEKICGRYNVFILAEKQIHRKIEPQFQH